MQTIDTLLGLAAIGLAAIGVWICWRVFLIMLRQTVRVIKS